MKLTIGTGVYVDFPTSTGNIYTRQAINKALSNNSLRQKLLDRSMVGGILNSSNNPVNDVVTHKVLDIKLYKDEIVVDIEVLDNDDSLNLISLLDHPQAVIIMANPQPPRTGQVITVIDEIRTVHLKENTIYRKRDEDEY